MQDKSSKDLGTLKFHPVIAIQKQRNENVIEARKFMNEIQKNKMNILNERQKANLKDLIIVDNDSSDQSFTLDGITDRITEPKTLEQKFKMQKKLNESKHLNIISFEVEEKGFKSKIEKIRPPADKGYEKRELEKKVEDK